MQTLKFETREEWLEARRGKITGSRLKDIIVKRGTGQKKGFYELIAERLAIPADGELPMDRGTRLEDVAIARFTQETGREIDTSLIIWARDDNDSIAVSPDGVVKKSKDSEAVEVKCLNSASHVEALVTHEIPKEYEDQVLQYFIVNDKLKKVYFVFYDPRMTVKDFFFFEVTRESLGEKISEFKEYQVGILEEVERIVKELTF